MAYRLRNGVTFCEIADSYVFLDTPQDRYFGLAADAQASFRRLVAGAPLGDGDARLLGELGVTGATVTTEGEQPALAPPRLRVATESLLDDLTPATTRDLALALWHIVAAARRLRRRGLAGSLDHLGRQKRRVTGGIPLERARRITAGFVAAAAVATAHDKCLPRSLALAARLVAAGGAPDLVIGVKLQPFKAHCWVQLDGRLVNERVDVARAFTPILVL